MTGMRPSDTNQMLYQLSCKPAHLYFLCGLEDPEPHALKRQISGKSAFATRQPRACPYWALEPVTRSQSQKCSTNVNEFFFLKLPNTPTVLRREPRDRDMMITATLRDLGANGIEPPTLC